MVVGIQEYTFQICLQVVLRLQDPVELVRPELLSQWWGGCLTDSLRIYSMVPVCRLEISKI